MSTPTDLHDPELPYLRAGRLVVRVLPRAALAADPLAPEDAVAGVAYRSIHGEVIQAPEDTFRLLDTFLEKHLPAAFAPVPARRHWEGDDEDEDLPAGPGPFGSGLRALGSQGERLVLPRPERDEDDEDPERDEDDEDESDEDEDEEDVREPWREVTGDDRQLQDWLLTSLPADSLNDCAFPWPSDDRPGYDRAVAEFLAARAELADRVLARFPNDRTRYFLGGHAGWDRHGEDYLSRDIVSAFVTDHEVLVIWTRYDRWYG